MNSEIQFGGYAHDIEDDRNKVAEITKANTNETNYPSTAAVVKAISEIDIPEVDLSGKMDKFGEVTVRENGVDVNVDNDKGVFVLHQNEFCSIKMSGSEMRFDAPHTYFEGATTFSNEMVVQEPTWEANPATKGYVDNLVSNAKEELSADQIYDSESPNAQSGIAVAEAVKNNPDRHAEYFTITDDGIVSLKPEYRGACPSNRSQYTFAISDNGLGNVGSKNAELPKFLYIPEVVGNVAVYELAPAMFIGNQAIVGIVCPTTVNEIPERFCNNAWGLKSVYGTENIEYIGKGAFSGSGVEKLYFPKLKEFVGTGVFSNSNSLIFVDIGNVTTIPNVTFSNTLSLNRIKNSAEITSIGDGAFYLSGNLKNIDFIPTVTSIGKGAFLQSRYTYDWDALTNCTFGTNATSKQINPTDYWSGCTFTPHKNNLPTLLCQVEPEWANRSIGSTSWTYSQGCVLFSYMHIYCSLHNLKLSTVLEWESIMAEADPNLINTFSPHIRDSVTFLAKLGLKAEYHSSVTGTEDAQGIYDALSNGKCVILEVPSAYTDTQGHAVIAYGINECGELLIANSSGFVSDGTYPKAATYTVSPKNIPNINEYCIVSL